ncbi:hypothetical protein AMTRI_Chr05g64550 [Amborella trichopoda]|uniref:Glycosyl transferase family 1 domain-containing protein n=1 Tax=Amborella trichopoda TaxID=13333 RepID=W1PG34_AMBTC|nr:uncharacterized protein LOC18434232 [Amborella trichopoda]XP_011623371.1 uncharacterized protein LOC18434232 [Amborella trichopoda]XP_020522870.1 uncharacterized protein LOC18434232 [Amborella trichopoda]XP_020522871.1 uncharacterized protein LOC18434232 [Amborella trichopoda]XP_020522872.1 uncharacterized protein LOC18434232 [Amborella trichopoda]XP_020522873.1 uncharacterized protein LOC18434232 [Amborella trichopoda]ERN06045.1 hypothetical protein AMTR_s00142p00066020 [Amborella trichop|eukprot:XP_006844370.1 uncharacterized protein LOC18434232 [Amborella trichopoda]
MDETDNNRRELPGTLRQISLRPSGSLKSTLSGRLTPRSSPSFRRSHFSHTPRKEGRIRASPAYWVRSKRLLPLLVIIAVWSYVGFYVQSRWAHHEDNEQFLGYQSNSKETNISNRASNQSLDPQNKPHTNHVNSLLYNVSHKKQPKEDQQGSDQKRLLIESLKKKGNWTTKEASLVSIQRGTTTRKPKRSNRTKQKSGKVGARGSNKNTGNNTMFNVGEFDGMPSKNTSYGLVVGPFGNVEDSVLGWSAGKRSGTCDRKGEFAHMVWGRSFVVILHELSMTGAPLSMMELATELLSCGGTVSAVVLSKKGGLMAELSRRGIKVLKDKADFSYKVAMKADLVIAGSAVCSDWIEQYLANYPSSGSQIIWWIMENRRPYFDRAKNMLDKVKKLLFLSESQSQQWLTWCKEEHIRLKSPLDIVPLSVNDELAFVAGFNTSLSTPTFSIDKMLERRKLLRDEIRREMGLTPNDMLVMTLSSINPGKGQLLFLESALLTISKNFSSNIDYESHLSLNITSQDHPTMEKNQQSRILLEPSLLNNKSTNGSFKSFGSTSDIVSDSENKSSNFSILSPPRGHKHKGGKPKRRKRRKLLSENEDRQEQGLKILIGSMGSKSNKVLFVKVILRFLSQHPELSKLMLWTPATTNVASLYAAADVYVINAQGHGETFGRVTIEAMAFGLPILGTDAGGTREIVDHEVNGLLHPLGRDGVPILAQNIHFLLKNPWARERMGLQGRSKVEKMFLKHHMYNRLAGVLHKVMKIK